MWPLLWAVNAQLRICENALSRAIQWLKNVQLLNLKKNRRDLLPPPTFLCTYSSIPYISEKGTGAYNKLTCFTCSIYRCQLRKILSQYLRWSSERGPQPITVMIAIQFFEDEGCVTTCRDRSRYFSGFRSSFPPHIHVQAHEHIEHSLDCSRPRRHPRPRRKRAAGPWNFFRNTLISNTILRRRSKWFPLQSCNDIHR